MDYTYFASKNVEEQKVDKHQKRRYKKDQKNIEVRSSQMQKNYKARKQPGVNQEDGPP